MTGMNLKDIQEHIEDVVVSRESPQASFAWDAVDRLLTDAQAMLAELRKLPYANVRVPRPTCVGYWWLCNGDKSIREPLYIQRVGDDFYVISGSTAPRLEDFMRTCTGLCWTGPIPLPEKTVPEEPAQAPPSESILAGVKQVIYYQGEPAHTKAPPKRCKWQKQVTGRAKLKGRFDCLASGSEDAPDGLRGCERPGVEEECIDFKEPEKSPKAPCPYRRGEYCSIAEYSCLPSGCTCLPAQEGACSRRRRVEREARTAAELQDEAARKGLDEVVKDTPRCKPDTAKHEDEAPRLTPGQLLGAIGVIGEGEEEKS